MNEIPSHRLLLRFPRLPMRLMRMDDEGRIQ